MYPQFEKREAHQMGKYIGRLVNFYGDKLEVVGYSHKQLMDEPLLIIDASLVGGRDQSAWYPKNVKNIGTLILMI